MASEENREAEAIAASWGIDASLLEDIEWTVDTIDGNDGEHYGYIVRFDDDTSPETLSALGLEPGEFTRQLSINAFGEPDYDDEDYDRDLRIKQGVEDGGGFADAAFAGNAFAAADRAGEADDGLSSIDEPLPDISEVVDDLQDGDDFPDLSPNQVHLTDENDSILTDEHGHG